MQVQKGKRAAGCGQQERELFVLELETRNDENDQDPPLAIFGNPRQASPPMAIAVRIV
jgi:hypothetical protein